MKQHIQLKLNQHLSMTPQLQQAMRLLQLSAMELQQEVQDLLESNVMLEREDEAVSQDIILDVGTPHTPIPVDCLYTDTTNLCTQAAGTADTSRGDEPSDTDATERENESAIDMERTNLAAEWPIDSDWTDVYDSYALGSYSTGNAREYDIDAVGNDYKVETTLHDYLHWQLNLIPLSKGDILIATAIVDAVGDDGYLSISLEDIREGVEKPKPELDEILAMLHLIQSLDPPGVAARNLRECLLIQLQQLPADTAYRNDAIEFCKFHLDLLLNGQRLDTIKNPPKIMDNIQSIMRLLRTLHPYPNHKITTTPPQFIIPDVFVSKQDGVWRVEINPDTVPRLRVNPYYAKLVKRADRSIDNICLKNHLQEARWFLKNLHNRNETLLRVANKIIELQRNFFEYGHEAMQPLVLRDIADSLGVHESTVSRVTNQKYLYSPRGTFEFKFFFPSHVSTNGGGQCSATAIRAIIKKLIAAEQPNYPLSDDAIAKYLANQGIQAARRTVAKYRESIGIKSSTARRRLL